MAVVGEGVGVMVGVCVGVAVTVSVGVGGMVAVGGGDGVAVGLVAVGLTTAANGAVVGTFLVPAQPANKATNRETRSRRWIIT
jgi:hypothetical protein